MLSEGGELEDPVSFVHRVNRLIVEGLSAVAQDHTELRVNGRVEPVELPT